VAKHAERQKTLEVISANNPDLPTGRLFSVVLIDVPRRRKFYSGVTGSEKAPENHYPTMSFEQLINFPIDSFAARDSVLLYWSTAASLVDDLEIIAEWGLFHFVSGRRHKHLLVLRLLFAQLVQLLCHNQQSSGIRDQVRR
jgi:hypothetical protein